MKAEMKSIKQSIRRILNNCYGNKKDHKEAIDKLVNYLSHLTTPDSLPTDREAGDYYDKISNKRVYHDLSLKDTFGQGFWACFGWLRSIQQLSPNSGGRDEKHECEFYVNADWTDYSRCECGKKYESTQTPPPDEGERCNCRSPIMSPPKPHRIGKIQKCGRCLNPLKDKFQFNHKH